MAPPLLVLVLCRWRGISWHAAVDAEPSVEKSVFLALRPSWNRTLPHWRFTLGCGNGRAFNCSNMTEQVERQSIKQPLTFTYKYLYTLIFATKGFLFLCAVAFYQRGWWRLASETAKHKKHTFLDVTACSPYPSSNRGRHWRSQKREACLF